MKISLPDIGEIVNRAKLEKERQEHKSLSVQAYKLFSNGKTPLQVAIILNIGQTEVTHYYAQYLTLVGLMTSPKYIWNLKATHCILCNYVKQQRKQKWAFHS